jgi:hypothetical protein
MSMIPFSSFRVPRSGMVDCSNKPPSKLTVTHRSVAEVNRQPIVRLVLVLVVVVVVVLAESRTRAKNQNKSILTFAGVNLLETLTLRSLALENVGDFFGKPDFVRGA